MTNVTTTYNNCIYAHKKLEHLSIKAMMLCKER